MVRAAPICSSGKLSYWVIVQFEMVHLMSSCHRERVVEKETSLSDTDCEQGKTGLQKASHEWKERETTKCQVGKQPKSQIHQGQPGLVLKDVRLCLPWISVFSRPRQGSCQELLPRRLLKFPSGVRNSPQSPWLLRGEPKFPPLKSDEVVQSQEGKSRHVSKDPQTSREVEILTLRTTKRTKPKEERTGASSVLVAGAPFIITLYRVSELGSF